MLLQVDFEVHEAHCRPQGLLRPLHKWSFAVVIEIDQSEAGTQPVMVLREAAVSHPVESELALQHPVPSVVRHTDGHLFRTARARVTFSRMSVALAVQMKGLGF